MTECCAAFNALYIKSLFGMKLKMKVSNKVESLGRRINLWMCLKLSFDAFSSLLLLKESCDTKWDHMIWNGIIWYEVESYDM